MTTIVTRQGKGAALSWAEVDGNFTNLNTDKLEVGAPATDISVTPVGTIASTDVQAALAELDTALTDSITASIGMFVAKTGDTGAAIIPKGTTAQRPAVPIEGYFRRNSQLAQWEGYDGANWTGIGGASGGGGNPFCYENDKVVTTNYTITTGKNAMTAGPITINDGVTVTIPDGSTWSII